MSRALRLRARSVLVESLSRAMADTGSTQRAVAEQAEVSPITVRRWLHGETPINVEAVLSCPGIGEAFREHLCIHVHEAPRSLPVILRAPKRKTKRGAR